ncbi:hypothetical protein [Mesorhizobium sp. M1A.T.Ca.IN.004.03.1.1]|uniref:hypothetical protein n=1 Tax=Mesorhizobium sp. M1A.T.Ca.IN.004.03.1.1 TaxID=2496795 RepID=UPI00247870A8|nr:hypothetical protein [Mesorhizobium sp. M1A.T.Ca.IN.004.03.1.1]
MCSPGPEQLKAEIRRRRPDLYGVVTWVAARTRQIGRPGYHPVLHFDVYGWVGQIWTRNASVKPGTVSATLQIKSAINMEFPADFGSTQAQIENYAWERTKPVAGNAEPWSGSLRERAASA